MTEASHERHRRWPRFVLSAALVILLSAGMAHLFKRRDAVAGLVHTAMEVVPAGNVKRLLMAALGMFAPAGFAVSQTSPALQPPSRPAIIGMNLAEVQYYSSTAPFANLVIGSEWNDSSWQALSSEYQNSNGDIRSLPADGIATRFLLVPPTGPDGFEVRCTFSGSGTLSVSGLAGRIEPGPHMLKFRLVNEHGKQPYPWLILKDVDPRHPPRDLDCRDLRLDRSTRFRPEFIRTLRGYGVIRFMDWQNANANDAVAWHDRHTPASINLRRDGVSIEDMLALTRELGADPWFVMPWNATDDYITRFAQMVRMQLPAERSVYVEVGNEVWNMGFSVGKQAIKEGLERKLAVDQHEAGMRRYAERTVEVMRLWETAFAGRRGLVRVLATQHVWPHTAEIALSFRDTAEHVDALATAPYFGATLGGTENTRDSSLKRLTSELSDTIRMIVDNRRIATGYGKRYIGYEGGQGLALPAQVPLSSQLQHDPAMYDLYQRYLAQWRQQAGDVLCLFNSVARPTSWGSWGHAEWEDEGPAEAPKLRAVHEFMQAHRRPTTGQADASATMP